MTKLKTIMVMNEAKGLLLDLLATHYYVEERKNCMLRCVKDLSDCVKESDENVTQYDLMTENYNLRRAIKDIYILAERGISNQMFTPETAVLSRIKGDCYLALNEKDEK